MSARNIWECVGSEAIARRERRRKMILEQDEKSSTLGYHTLSDESISPPKNYCYVVNNKSSPERNSSLFCNADTLFSDTFLDFSGNTQPAEMETDPITYTMPEYADTVDRQRLVDALVLGALLGICSTFTNSVAGVSLVLLLLIAGYETFIFKSKNITYPKHGYIVNAMLAAGLNEDAVISLGLVIDVLWEVCIDVLLVLAGFSAVRILLTVISYFADP